MTSETTIPIGYRSNELTIPERLRPFAEPALIAGESREDYELLRQLLIEDIQPRSNLEWLWLFDLAELAWEILRYRKLKVRAIEMHRVKAIEALLLQIDGAGFPENDPLPRWQTRINAAEWRINPSARMEIQTRLARNGFDLETTNAEALLKAQTTFSVLDALLGQTQRRQATLWRELLFHSSYR